MKKRIFTIFGLSLICVAVIFIASTIDTLGGTSVYAYTSGSPGQVTGSPMDGADCTDCHSGTAGNGTVSITSNIPGSGYVPGNTYQVTAAVIGTSSAKIGFEVTAESTSPFAKVGTIIITDGTRTSGGGSEITHTTAGTTTSAGNNAWQFDWTAPVAGTGAVTFYGSFLISNNNSSTSGDDTKNGTYSVIESGVGIEKINTLSTISIYPNPATNYIQFSSTKGVKSVEIFDLFGKKLVEENSSLEKINIVELSSGVYVVKMHGDNVTKVQKLTVY
jgi:hypothetical protein